MASYITSKSVIAVGAVLPGLATIAVALRFYSRRLISVHLGIDDWLIVCSLVSSLQRNLRNSVDQSPPPTDLDHRHGDHAYSWEVFHSHASFTALMFVELQVQHCMH